MAIRKVFKSRIPSINFFFKNGMQGPFMLGRFETDLPYQIQELTAEVDNGHPHIYIDSAETEVDTEAPTPMEIIRQEAYDKARADLIASGLMSDKVSTSDSGAFKDSVTNTTNIAEAAAGSDGGSAAMAINEAAASSNIIGVSAGGVQAMSPAAMSMLASLKK